MTPIEKKKLWENLVADYRTSGKTAAEWCVSNDSNIHQLRYWCRRFKKVDESTISKPMQWVSVEVSELEHSMHKKTLSVRVGKAIIDVCSGFDPTLLSEVIRTLTLL